MLDHLFRTARSSVPNAPRVESGGVPSARTPHTPVALKGPEGLMGAPKRLQGAGEQSSPVRSPLPPSALNRQPVIGRSQTEIQPHVSDGHTSPTHETSPSQPVRRQTLRQLLDEALREEKAEKAEQARQAKQARRAALAQWVHSALPDGGQAMKRLKARAAREHPATLADRLLLIRHGTPRPMEGPRKTAFEALVRDDLWAMAMAGGVDPLVAVDKMAEALDEGILGQGILKSDLELLTQVLDDLAIDRLYTRLNLKMTDDTMPAFTNAQVLEAPVELGEGRISKVYAVKLEDTDGSELDAVFKPLNSEVPDVEEWSAAARLAGISREDPQTAMRNLATVAYAKMIGFHVVTDTRVALIDIGDDPFNPALGLIMERARGEPAEEVDAEVFKEGSVCAEVTKLQLLDHLTGEADRYDKNYFVELGSDGRAKVMGIDNDTSFGAALTDPAGAKAPRTNPKGVAIDPSRLGLRGTALPPVVDTDMESAVLALTEEGIVSILEDKLNDAEVDAAIERYRGVRQHMVELREAGRVIAPHEWGRSDIQELFTPENSYLGRDRELAWVASQP